MERPLPAIVNPLADRLRADRVALALMVRQVRSVDIALAAHTCGYDAVYFDLQHTPMPEDVVGQIAVASLAAGITPIARIPGQNHAVSLRLLDAGVLGIIVPDVASADEARAAVEACKFAPVGRRSVAGAWPHFGYRSVPAQQARATLNDHTLVIVMIETPAALDQADAIAAVPGVDVLHMGCNDMLESMDLRGQFGHARLAEAYTRMVAACRRHGKVAGLGGMAGDLDLMRRYVGLGARFLTAGNDWAFLMSAARERAQALRALDPD